MTDIPNVPRNDLAAAKAYIDAHPEITGETLGMLGRLQDDRAQAQKVFQYARKHAKIVGPRGV
jgi:hypothetical protein